MNAPAIVGAVLVGGESSRMGTDKALLDLDGVPLGARAVSALRGAGVERVLLVGGSPEHERVLEGTALEDLWPGEGPAGGVLSALHAAFLEGAGTVVILACDLPAITPAAVERLLTAAPALTDDPAVVVAGEGGRAAWPCGVWPVRLLPRLEARFVDGASSVVELVGDVPIIEVDGSGAFVDVDDPESLDGFR